MLILSNTVDQLDPKHNLRFLIQKLHEAIPAYRLNPHVYHHGSLANMGTTGDPNQIRIMHFILGCTAPASGPD